MCPTWPGWPLPQLGVPHIFHSLAEHTASQEPQNSGVIPVYVGLRSIAPSFAFIAML